VLTRGPLVEVMAVDGGEEEATSADLDGAMDDQRRRRRLTLAPTPFAMDEVTVEEIFDDDSDSRLCSKSR
jgi:hypothetical protein